MPDLTDPGLWVLGSLLAAVVATNIAWLVVRGRLGQDGRPQGAAWEIVRPLAWLATALFLFLPPIGAWRAGALSPYLAGLTEIDWVQSLGDGGLLTCAVIGLLVFGWLVYRRTAPRRMPGLEARGAWRVPLDAALLQWHWAFYRAGMAGWLALAAEGQAGAALLRYLPSALTAQAFYWGNWLGMAVVAIEWALNPFARRALSPGSGAAGYPLRAGHAALRIVLAVATTALFAVTRNFWLVLLCQVTVETAIAILLPVPAAHTSPE